MSPLGIAREITTVPYLLSSRSLLYSSFDILAFEIYGTMVDVSDYLGVIEDSGKVEG